MADLYFKKKEQLSSPQAKSMGDISAELNKARSQTPNPPSRSGSVEPVLKTSRKVVYSHEFNSQIDDHKSTVSNLEKTMNEKLNVLEKTLIDKLDEQAASVNAKFEGTKVDSLKSSLNDAVKNFNDNMKAIANKMIEHDDAVNTLKSRVDEIENIL